MNNYEEMYENICRVCLSYKETNNKISLTDNNSEDGLSIYGKAVTTFANIVISKDSNLPRLICSECVKLLKQAIFFKLKCENSDKHLQSWSETFNLNGNSENKLEEIIVQNIMFLQCFPEGTNQNSNGNSLEKSDNKTNEDFNDNDSNDELSIQSAEECTQNSTIDDKYDQILNLMESCLADDDYTPFNFKMKQRSLLETKDQFKMSPAKNLKTNRLTKTLKTNEKFFCAICNKSMANKNTYRYHMQRHNGCKFICEHCGKGFPVLAELLLHKRTKHDSGPYLKCKHCEYKAPTPHNLIEHERLHTGERPYTCDKCGLTFRRRAIWKKHLVYHTEKTVPCTHCSRKFYMKSEMLSHVNSVHERKYMYLCDKCDTVYAKTATVRRHLTERHGIPREMQGKITRIDKTKGVSLSEQ